MAVYIDNGLARNRNYSHLFADSVDELHAFATKVGIHRCWYSNKRGKRQPHYDVSDRYRERCLAMGAIPVSWRLVPDMLRRR